MRGRTPVRLAWAVGGLCAAMAVSALVLAVVNPARASVPATVLTYVVYLVFPAVGALVAANRPRNPMGWMFLALGLLFGIGSLALEYAWYSVAVHGGSLPLTAALNSITSGWWAPFLGLLAVYTLLLFPDGHLPSRRWLPVAWIAGVGIALLAAGAPM